MFAVKRGGEWFLFTRGVEVGREGEKHFAQARRRTGRRRRGRRSGSR